MVEDCCATTTEGGREVCLWNVRVSWPCHTYSFHELNGEMDYTNLFTFV